MIREGYEPGAAPLVAGGDAAITGAPAGAAPLVFTRRAGADGQAVVAIRGELDIGTADAAYAYVRDVINEGAKSVAVDISGLTFCDARGLATLARMARYADDAECLLRLIAPPPRVLKIMRITGFDRRFPGLTTVSIVGERRSA